jgi:hypothetical protein
MRGRILYFLAPASGKAVTSVCLWRCDINATKRNVLLAALLAGFFAVGAFLIIRPAFQSDPAGEDSLAEEGNSPGSQSSDDPNGGESSSTTENHGSSPSAGQNRSGRNSPVKAWRIGGATVDNQYPVENFSQGITTGRSCAVLENLSPTLPVTVVSVSVGPSGVWEAQGCVPTLSATDLTGAVPCAAGVVLPPRQPPRRGCSVGVKLLVTGGHSGAVTLVTRVECTTRAVEPCTRLPSNLHPTADYPIRLTVDQTIGFTGSDVNDPINKETATPPPSPKTEPSTETEEPPTTTASPSA